MANLMSLIVAQGAPSANMPNPNAPQEGAGGGGLPQGQDQTQQGQDDLWAEDDGSTYEDE